MSDNFENRLGRLGARLDDLIQRARAEGHEVDDFIAKVRTRRDESWVRLNLAKLEAEERVAPVFTEIANALVQIEDDLDAVAESIRRSVTT